MRIRHGCGVELNVPDELAGKRVKCPRCGEEFPVSRRAPAGGEALGEGKPSQCPRCGRALAAGSVICVACGLNLKTGERLTTAVSGGDGRGGPLADVGLRLPHSLPDATPSSSSLCQRIIIATVVTVAAVIGLALLIILGLILAIILSAH